jgi:fatty acid desaturase
MKKSISTSEFIKRHTKYVDKSRHDDAFLEAHSHALATLRHERLIHLIVTISVTVFCLIFFGLYLFFSLFPLLIIFIILLVVTFFYYIYYYKLENTVIKWEEIEREARG